MLLLQKVISCRLKLTQMFHLITSTSLNVWWCLRALNFCLCYVCFACNPDSRCATPRVVVEYSHVITPLWNKQIYFTSVCFDSCAAVKNDFQINLRAQLLPYSTNEHTAWVLCWIYLFVCALPFSLITSTWNVHTQFVWLSSVRHGLMNRPPQLWLFGAAWPN